MSGTLQPASVGGIDASVPLRAGEGVQQPNPLTQIGQFAGAVNALNQNRLFPLVQQQHQLAIQQQQQALDLGAMHQHLTRLDYGAGAMVPLLFDPKTGDPTTGVAAKDITSALATAVGDGFMKAEDAAKLLGTLPNGGDDPSLNRKWVVQHYTQNQAARGQIASAIQALSGAPGATRDTGQEVQSGSTAGALTQQPGAFRPAGTATQTYPSRVFLAGQVGRPATAAEAQALGVPVGTPLDEPMVNRLFQQGRGDLVGPAGGGLPPSLRNPARQPPTAVAPPVAAPTAAPTGAVPSALSPAQSAAQSQTGGQSAKAFQDIADQGVKARAQDATLANMQADAAQFVTGPGADTIKLAKSLVVRLGDALGTDFGIDKAKLAANVSFDKLANQIADAQGAGSDARLAVNQAANPSSHLTPEGVDLVLRQLRGNADYLKIRAQLAAAYPDKSDREGFESRFGANLDPRVFQYLRLKPEQRHAYFTSLTDKEAFKRSYNWAEDNKLTGTANGGQ